LLFNDAPKVLLEKIEQVIRLIRSKGVGVYFVTQNPLDVPDIVLGQLGNRVQHALRAFTPRDQKAVKAAAQTFRQNKDLDVESAITELGVGEALVSLLSDKGQPTVVDRALIYPPKSQLPPLTPAERDQVIKQSAFYGHYEKVVDRESAYEMLKTRAPQADQTRTPSSPTWQSEAGSLLEAAGKSAVRAMGTQVGREIIRGVLGSIFGSSTRKRR
jgi:DNA helicase HerA-like ATPase